MTQLRKSFLEMVERYKGSVRNNVYLLLYTRERTLQLLAQVKQSHPEVSRFTTWLLGRDEIYIKHLTGERRGPLSLEEAGLTLCEAVVLAGDSPTHWWSGQSINASQLVFELMEEESAQRGELSVLLGRPPS